jgi:hypothetical protein
MSPLQKESILKTALIHEKRLVSAHKKLAVSVPFTKEKILHLSEEEILWIELMVSRFAKLQDLMGTKIFHLFFDEVNENDDNLTMLDKLHKLEKFAIISDKDVWTKMRELRNHLAHEYPDQPELTAEFLNQTYELSHTLIDIWHKLLGYLK